MAYVDWMIKGVKVSACNCDWGCPCEFNAKPTYGVCEGLEASIIDEGWFGDVRLDGVLFGATFRWPGPLHEGGGLCQSIFDERSSAAQRAALEKILSGEDQAADTMFNVIGSTFEKEFDPVTTRIELDYDFEARTGRIVLPGVGDIDMEPIRNPVTGAPHFARIQLPGGFEFREAEMTSSTFKGTGALEFDHAGRYGFLIRYAYGPEGIID
jgi:hypothetical protein